MYKSFPFFSIHKMRGYTALHILLIILAIGLANYFIFVVVPALEKQEFAKQLASREYSSPELTQVAKPAMRLVNEMKIDSIECESDTVTIKLNGKWYYSSPDFERRKPVRPCSGPGRLIIGKGAAPKIVGTIYFDGKYIEKDFKSAPRQYRETQFAELVEQAKHAYASIDAQTKARAESDEAERKYKEEVAASWAAKDSLAQDQKLSPKQKQDEVN